MRNVILKDKKIDKEELLTFIEKYTKFIKKHTGIEPEFYIEQHDFSTVPTTPDSDGDLKPTFKYRQSLATDVHKRYGDYGTDNIIMLVHEDNFLFKGIWGSNWSSSHYKYSFQLVRWDKDNPANTFGTFYHEQMHSFDSTIKNETGYDIEPDYQGDWDKFVVHGGRPDMEKVTDWKYIRYQENTEALSDIKLRLAKAYEIRLIKHKKHLVKLLNTIVRLMRMVIDLRKNK